ncbi:unnamed protein product [Sphagnum jensenii]|uniref:Uncharacterized protein n=1 Tax=Sphagnum jensenii TaxID=128206 RepID=A0ABP0VPU5_9BRYO
MGVPMIAWPLWANHMINLMLFLDIFNKIQDPTQAVGHEEIERIIRLLMEDRKGSFDMEWALPIVEPTSLLAVSQGMQW